MENPWHLNTIKNHNWCSQTKSFMLIKSWIPSHLAGKESYYCTFISRISLQNECELYLKQLLTLSQHNIIVACRISNHRLNIETDKVIDNPYY